MILFFIAFLAGVLTVLAPCVLPLLPIIIGGSLGGTSKWRPFVVTLSLAVSVVVFTLLLRVSTLFLAVPVQFWSVFSGVLVFLLGLFFLFPNVWTRLSARIKFDSGSHKLMDSAQGKGHLLNAAIIGVSLGPVFTSCSPTYALILAIALPASFAAGFIYIVAYALGLASIMLLVALLGQRIVLRLKLLAHPNGIFKKILAVIFIVVGLTVAFGFDKKIEAYAISKGWYGALDFEEKLIKDFQLFDRSKGN